MSAEEIERRAAELRQHPVIRDAVRNSMVEPFNVTEGWWDSATLPALEAVIERGMASFVQVGTALATVRDRNLWAPEFESFEAYCEARWNITRSYASRLITAADVVTSLPIGNTPTNEAQARELAKVPADRRAEVMDAVGPNPTAAAIAAAARTYLTGPTPEPAPEPASATAAPEHDPAPGGGAHITEPPARSTSPDEAPCKDSSSSAAGEAAAEVSPGEEGLSSPGQPEKPTPTATIYRRARTRAVSALREMGDPRKVWAAGNAADRDALVDTAREMQAWADQIMALDKKARLAS